MKTLFTIIFLCFTLFAEADSWVQKANFGGTARYGATGFSIGSKGYIGLGVDTSTRRNDFWEYDPLNNTWTQKANFGGISRWFAIGFAIGTKGYIGTGLYYDSIQHFLNDFWEYDPDSNTWAQKANFGGTPRCGATGFAIGTNGYIGTGYDGNERYDFWEYGQGNNTWTQKTNFGGVARDKAVSFAIGTKGYIGTGDDLTTGHKDFWEFDPDSNTWTQKANFGGTARQYSTSFAIGSKGYIGTGYDNNSYLRNDFWEYDQGSNTWSQKTYFGGVIREQAVGFAIDAKGYIGTGDGFGPYYNDFWEYTPDSTNGIEELNIDNVINIYPNPLTSSSILQFNTQLIPNESGAEVVIYDMVGKQMLRRKLTGSSMEIEKGGLESGVYFVKLTSGERQWVEKMVVE